MYKRAMSLLMLGNIMLLFCFLCVREIESIVLSAQPVNQMRLNLEQLEEKAREKEMAALGYTESEDGLMFAQGLGIMKVAVSGQRVVDYDLVEQELYFDLSDEDLEALLRIVEAEAGSEDEDGRLLVANVVLNRVNSERFPSTVKEVVLQQSHGVAQFSPVSSGRYYKVVVSEETVQAVNRALAGEDISQGALFFASRKRADSNKMRWFDTKLTFLFEHGGHEFFK